MKVIFSTLFSFILTSAFSQSFSAYNATRYEINCFTEFFVSQSISDVEQRPDTTFNLPENELAYLNDFLEIHSRYKTPADTAFKNQFDFRIVISFYDNSGKQHQIGFDCAGNYQLDGNNYFYNPILAVSENNLKIGVIKHQPLLEEKPNKRN